MYRYIKCSLTDNFDEFYEAMQEINQEFTSENTSINKTKLPAVFSMVKFEPGTVNLDYGGGKFDNVADYLTQYDVINLVYDPFNRTSEHNREVMHTIWECDGADSITCSNVLNVIKEYDERMRVLKNMKNSAKPGAPIYITVYEGDGEGEGRQTSETSYQLNKKIKEYLAEIQEVFPDAIRKGKIIICHG